MAPNLFIIAGPNGAGKSLFSNSLVEVDFKVFDGDKHIALLKKLYPETGSEALQSSVNENIFTEAKNLAIRQKGNFAFETNFSAEDPTHSFRQFKAAGYKCHLVFMGMQTVEQCIQRVSFRVKAGGHQVTEQSIQYNFTHGYKNLYKYFTLFNSVTLMDSSIAEGDAIRIPQKILVWKKGKIKLFKSQYPQWVEKFIAENKSVADNWLTQGRN